MNTVTAVTDAFESVVGDRFEKAARKIRKSGYDPVQVVGGAIIAVVAIRLLMIATKWVWKLRWLLVAGAAAWLVLGAKKE